MLSNIEKPKKSTFKIKRVGRGDGSGIGKTSGRGSNGQKCRAGFSRKAGFEGGQMPLIRRVPKRGFYNRFRVEYFPVNLYKLESFKASEEVSPTILIEKGLAKSNKIKIKILGQGKINKKLKIKVHAVSASAKKKIEDAGGTIELIN